MRNLAVTGIVLLSLLMAGCAVTLQPSQQGEWSDFHNNAHKLSTEVRPAEPGQK